MDDVALEVRRALAEGWPDTDLVRLLAQAVEDFGRLDSQVERTTFVLEPRPTGSAVWDAALAALAVHLCRAAGFDSTPDWTRAPGRFSTRIAWIGLAPDSALQAYVYQRTPAYFKARGVMLDEANLVSV